jgi:hypothetical protein
MQRFVTGRRPTAVAWRQTGAPGNPSANVAGATLVVTVSLVAGLASGGGGAITVLPRKHQHTYVAGRTRRNASIAYTRRSVPNGTADGALLVVGLTLLDGAASGGGPTSAVVGGADITVSVQLIRGQASGSLHMRTQVRNAVAALLAGLTSTGSHVFKTQARILPESSLPALVVTLGNESVSAASVHGPDLQEREIDIRVELVALANDGLDDLLDQILLEVESRFNQSGTSDLLDGLLKINDLAEISEIEIDTSGKKSVGRLVMTRRAVYYVLADNPTTPQ